MILALSQRLVSLPIKASCISLAPKAGIFSTAMTNTTQNEIPKKPLSAFFLYKKDNYGQLKAQRPDLSLAELTKELGRMYKSLPEATVKDYKDNAEKESQIYKDAMAKISPDVLQAKSKEKAEKSLKRVKIRISKMEMSMGKPLGKVNGHALFVAEQHQVAPLNLAVSEKLKMASAKWNALSESEKEAYKAKAAEENSKRDDQMKAWKAEMSETENMKKLNELLKRKSSLQAKLKEMSK